VDFRTRFPLRLWRPNLDDEVDAELDFHLEMRTRELMRAGVPEADARREAVARFGDLRRARRECRAIGQQREQRMRSAQYLSELWQDAAFALRQMIATPAFTLIAVATLALGIGATTAIFSVVNAVVLRPLPVPDPGRLVSVTEVWRDADQGAVSAGNFVDMMGEQSAFDAATASTTVSFTLARDEGAERVAGVKATGGFFKTYGVNAAFGRVFGPEDDEPGQDQVVVLSHKYWIRQFGGETGVLGKQITLDARPYTIIGVMPASFDFTSDAEDLWVPIAFTRERKAMHDEHYLSVAARLKDGVTIEQAQQQLDRIAADLRTRFPKDDADRGFRVSTMMSAFIGDYGHRLIVLLGAVGFVLLIACANVSNLLLARGAARSRELAVRSALGAGQGRLVRQLFTESVVLGLVSALAGIALAWVCIGILIARAPQGVPRLDQAGIDGTALAFAVVLAVVCSIVFGLVPAWRTARADINSTLKEGIRGAGSRGAKDVVRSILIGAEVALALVLLVGAGLLIRSAIATARVAPGFDPQGVYSARFSLPQAKYPQPDVLLQAVTAIQEGVSNVPGVRRAAVASNVPGAGTFSNGLVPEGEAPVLANVRQSMARFVSPGYFETMGIPILKGRDFTPADRAGSQLVMIVNQSLAKRLWPNADPIGRRVLGSAPESDNPAKTAKIVIGIVPDLHFAGPAAPTDLEFYQPLAQLDQTGWGWTRRTLFVVARTTADPSSLGPPVRRVISDVDPGIPLFSERTMEQRMAATLDTSRFNTMLLVVLGIIGLILAAVGIYGVVSYFASQQTSEIGIRMALGASRASVLKLVVWQAAVPVLTGVLAGAACAAFASRVLASQLIGVRPTDPATFATVAAVLLVVALCAALLPARRAAGLSPTIALQS